MAETSSMLYSGEVSCFVTTSWLFASRFPPEGEVEQRMIRISRGVIRSREGMTVGEFKEKKVKVVYGSPTLEPGRG